MQEVSAEIGESKNPMLYKPVLKNIGEKVDGILEEKAVGYGTLPWGIGLASLALINLVFGFFKFMRKD
ncbi:MAG: hypothetical protein AABX71_02470 [Nanoarchaeota archaeon]